MKKDPTQQALSPPAEAQLTWERPGVLPQANGRLGKWLGIM